MSERLNSVDIEDVLSSIRRLVSEDARPGAKGPAAPPARPEPEQVDEAEAAEPATPFFATSRSDAVDPPSARPAVVTEPPADKLILTPSLRIVPEADPDPIPDAAEAAADVAVEEVPEAPMLEDAPEEETPEEETAEAAPFHSIRIERGGARLDAVMDQVAQGLDAAEQDWEPVGEAPRAFASDWEEDIASAGTDSGVATADPADLPASTMAEVEDILQGTDLPQESLVSGETGMAWETAGWATPDWQAVEPEPAVTDASVPVQDEVPTELSEAPWSAIEDQPEPADLAATFVAEESAVIQKDDPSDLPDWARMEAEPVVEDPAVFAAAAGAAAAGAARSKVVEDPKWADAAEAQIRRELEEGVENSAFAQFDEDDHDERRFDEEMLRDLVRDIIREELQGALGERITRNVRKLVRAEIARAMAVRDFE